MLSSSVARRLTYKDLSLLLKLGLVTENFPLNDSSVNKKLLSKETPLPIKLFSFIPKPMDPPEVPKPAVAEISPVGFSSTKMPNILVFTSSVSDIFCPTVVKKFKLCMLLIDLLNKILLNGSTPSSSNWLRITLSSVIELP